jgi:hypothetical protein
MKSHSALPFLVTFQTNNGVTSTISLSLQLYSFSRQIFEGTIAQGFCLYTDYEINSLNTERSWKIIHSILWVEKDITTKMIRCCDATARIQITSRLDAVTIHSL